jgi:RND family efflux transporter MFP subunit
MSRVWGAGVAVVAAILLFEAGSLYRQWTANRPPAGAREVLYYRDPMHPSYTSATPGKAPDCGMDLVPVYADGAGTGAATSGIPGAVRIEADRQEMIGIKVGRVERGRSSHTLRTFGRVVPAEDRIFPIMAGASGWVTKIEAGTATGDRVTEGQPLISIFGRDYPTAQRTYLYALQAAENPAPAAGGRAPDQVTQTLQEARLSLQDLGFGDAQIQQLTKTRQVMLEAVLTAPVSGTVIARPVFLKQRFDRGTELLRIADLTRVWIAADVFAGDAADIAPGTPAVITLPSRPGFTMKGNVAGALPRFDGDSRTNKVRIEIDNPSLVLRPDMLVDVSVSISLPEATTVPASAVIDSGVSKIVFVARGDGVFEPRAVETGWRLDGRVQILRGLEPGESIVEAGNFLLNAESQRRRESPGGHD